MRMRFTSALYATGLAGAFAGGWFLKTAPPEAASGPGPGSGGEPARPPAPLTAQNVETASGAAWLEAASEDLATVRAAARPGTANRLLIDRLNAVLTIADPAERLPRWRVLLCAMRPEDAAAVKAMLWKNRTEGRSSAEETQAFWRRWGQVDAAAALAVSIGEFWGETPNILGGWAGRDSAAALAWLKANVKEWTESTAAVKGLLEGVAEKSPEEAVSLMLTHAEDPVFKPSLGMAMDLMVRRRGITAAALWFKGLAEDSSVSGVFKAANLNTLVLNHSLTPAEETGKFRQLEIMKETGRYTAEPWFPKMAASVLGETLGKLEPLTGAALLESIQDPETRKFFAGSLLNKWASGDPASLSVWLNQKRASPSFDLAASNLARHLSGTDPEAARAWGDQIRDPAYREATDKCLLLNPSPSRRLSERIQAEAGKILSN